MPTINMSEENIKYYMQVQEKVVKTIIHTIKKFWSENSETILAGMFALTGNIYIPFSD